MHIIKLNHPIDFEGGKLSEVTIRRSKVCDVNRANKESKNSFELGSNLAAILSGLPSSAIDEIDSSDFKKISDLIGSFLD